MPATISAEPPAAVPDLRAGEPRRGSAAGAARGRRTHIRQRLNIEHAVTEALGYCADLAQAAPRVLQAICQELGWDCGTCWYEQAPRAGLVCVGAWGRAAPAVDAFLASSRTLRLGSRPGGLIRRAWRAGEPVWVSELGSIADFQRADAAQAAGLRSGFAFPITAGGRVLGVFEFFSHRIHEPDAELLDCSRYLGSQIGQFCLRAQAQSRLRDSEKRFADTIELAAIGIAHVDTRGQYTHANPWFCELLGYSRSELLGMTVKQISHPEDRDLADPQLARMRSGEIDSFQVEKRYLRKDGTTVWVSLTVSMLHDSAGQPACDISIIQDISARKQAEERIRYLATHDGLTGLPNRLMFSELLNHTLNSARNHQRRFAVLFIDLDRFKFINDSLGHEAGDLLLREMASRLKDSLRSSDIVARLGGDEFVVLLPELANDDEAGLVARKILSAAIRPMQIAGQEWRVTASVGISVYPDDAQDEPTLLKHADTAMYHAKAEGKNNFQYYDEQLEQRSIERLTIETHLRRAIERDELSLHYQAKLDLASDRITGVEALLRWNSAELGAVPPAKFVPLAEESGLILLIGKWVLRQACAQAVAWQRAGLPALRMAVNLSPRQFDDPHLVDDVRAVLAETGMQPDLLELEVTESSVMRSIERAVEVLAALKGMGVRLAIDDFGTGYSSLAQLKRFPIDTLKVDRSFIREIPRDAEDMVITEAIIAMGKTLSLTVVAEGVETVEQQAFLRRHACDQMQGFYFSKPVAAADFAELLRSHQAVPQAALVAAG